MTNCTRSAVIWSTDGNDYDYASLSLGSYRASFHSPVDFFVLARPDADLHGVDERFGVRRVDPTPAMDALGFDPSQWRRNAWPFPIFYKLGIPLLDEFKEYKAVLSVDSDTFAVPYASHSPDELFDHPLGTFEIAGVPDLYESIDRTSWLIENTIPDAIRDELRHRVWSKTGAGCQAYVSAGVLLWNIAQINGDIDWYRRRCAAFWSNLGAYRFPEQDFISAMMHVDSRLMTHFNARCSGKGPYVVGDACIRHSTGSKGLLRNVCAKMIELNPDVRFAQARLRPRESFHGIRTSWSASSTCLVTCCDNSLGGVRVVNGMLDSLQTHCSDRFAGLDVFVLSDGAFVGKNLVRDGVRVIDVARQFDLSGLRASCNWRAGDLNWDRSHLANLFIPFLPDLLGYDYALYVDRDYIAVDGRALDILDEDLRGYDCGMAAAFDTRNGIYREHPRVRFCKSNVQSSYDIRDSDEILGRLNAGIYFSSNVFLANLAEMRQTFGTLNRICRIAVDSIGNGSPWARDDVFNSVCRIKRVTSSYNSEHDTRIHGNPVYFRHW